MLALKLVREHSNELAMGLTDKLRHLHRHGIIGSE
jgi:hypothetical protein